MKHHQYNSGYKFIKEPVDFNKYTDRQLLQYCLGATMYMPGTKDFAQAIINKKYPGLTSMVMCFEDACKEEDVPAAEVNSIHVLDTLVESVEKGIPFLKRKNHRKKSRKSALKMQTPFCGSKFLGMQI